MAKVYTCVVCGTEKECKHSLRLSRDKRVWQSNPVCPVCRTSLIRQARDADRFVPFFSLETSENEARRRNERDALNMPFLEKFGRKREKKSKEVSTPTN